MCGIVGIVGLEEQAVDLGVLQQMNDRVAHRGPDGEGFLVVRETPGAFQHTFVRKAAAETSTGPVRLGLGHRRLAILDLSELGLQPMGSRDNRQWIVFNGEIYNYLELKEQLKARGYVFRSRTDTEVLLNAYDLWGEQCLDHLQGMFGFAIWDSAKARLFCARDRLGIKPFYYANTGPFFTFASEIKSLLAVPGVKRDPNEEAVLGFLVHANCDYAERTIFNDVKALPAAHFLTLDLPARQVRLQRYWSLAPEPRNGPADRQVSDLRALLLDSMRQHLNSDVPAGSCLSGGLDSSTVVALAGNIWHERPQDAAALGDRFNTFTSCYADRQIDEREYALAVARSVGATPNLVFPAADDFWSEFQRMVWHQDMPFGGLSYYAQWRVMRAAKEAGVKVLLDGQGGDEVFGGYAKFRYAYLASLFRAGRLPRMIREMVATIRQGDRYVLDIRNGYRYLPKRLRAFLRVDSLLSQVLKADWEKAVTCESTPATRWWRNALGSQRNGHSSTLMQRIQVDDIVVDTLPQLLRMEDRSSMAFSLEARVPLLDHRIVEYGVSLPDHLKIQRGWSKYALREAMGSMLPDMVRCRKSKLGFAAPDRTWLTVDLRPQISKLLGEELRCSKYVHVPALRQWYASSQARVANTESLLGLFRILALEMWMRAFDVR